MVVSKVRGISRIALASHMIATYLADAEVKASKTDIKKRCKRTKEPYVDCLVDAAIMIKTLEGGQPIDPCVNIDYGLEVTVAASPDGKFEVRVPAFPAPCSFVRVTKFMTRGRQTNVLELAYWDSLEWYEEPAEVMGAIMGAIVAVNAGTYVPV